ncbi:hypothetical protein EOD29_34590, partial [Mesorhizobium sp. M1A.T.Ca.IN.004.03.1.1]|uniref:hypothetical protein n=1 Tax=Mesorhizobium sp. M1A.T.Ca.IN.004.03.1.1 TaxID=2496795 RepID=UPI000FD3C80F
MADFAAIGRIVAKVCEWPEGTLESLMTALQAERDAFINEEDPLVRLLHTWIGHKYRAGKSNIGRVIDSLTL